MLLNDLTALAELTGEQKYADELEYWISQDEEFQMTGVPGRPYSAVRGRPYYDAATLGAAWEDDALVVNPKWLPDAADGKTAEVQTPKGTVHLRMNLRDGAWEITQEGGLPTEDFELRVVE
jgi:hypothetical protein